MKFWIRLTGYTFALFAVALPLRGGGEEALSRAIPAGEVIKPWLVLGPIYEDVSAQEKGMTLYRTGRTESESNRSGGATIEAIRAEAAVLAEQQPREGAKTSLRGRPVAWRLVRDASPHFMWGRKFETNHLGAAVFYTTVAAAQPGPATFRLTTKIDWSQCDASLSVNGAVVCDTRIAAAQLVGTAKQYVFEANLKSGPNAVLIYVYKIDLTPQAGFQLEMVSTPIHAEVPLTAELTRADRAILEEDVESFELERELVKPAQPLRLRRRAPHSSVPVRVRLERMPEPTRDYAERAGKIVREVFPGQEAIIEVCRGDDLVDGRYRLWCSWLDAKSTTITSVDWEIFKVTPTPDAIGAARLAERKRVVLQQYAAMAPVEGIYRDIWRHLARYQIGETVPTEVIRAACEYVDADSDGADFVMLAILRLLSAEERRPRLPAEARQRIKQTVLEFRYWADEPAGPNISRNLASENHLLQWHVAEFVAGQLYPTENFKNSQQRGLFHAHRARGFIRDWLAERGRFGFDEWHSDVYYCINFASLATLRDQILPEDFKLRQKVDSMIETLAIYLATGSYDGFFGVPHRRTYGYDLRLPALQQISPISWLLFGRGQLLSWEGTRSPAGLVGVVPLAASGFELPEIVAAIANDRTEVADQRFRQGNWPAGTLRQGNLAVFRTPDYLLACLQDGGRGSFYDQVSVAQLTFKNDAVIFWSCPHTNAEGTRPDYWGGNVTLPRGVQYRNVMALTWRLAPFTWMTHCFLEPARFDEVRESGRWVFVRSGDGYAGVYSQNGFRRDVPGSYRGRELVCFARENSWLVECGRKADWGSFDRFVAAVSAAKIVAQDGALVYESPSVGSFTTGWDTTPTVRGQPIPLRNYPLADSPWVSSEIGSGRMRIKYRGEERDLWQ